MTQVFKGLLSVLFPSIDQGIAQSAQLSTTARLILGCTVIFSSILVFTPLYPVLPEAALDPSWKLAMNQAVAQGLVFGKDIIFTYGPLSALLTQAYHPATYPLTLVIGLLFGVGYATMLLTQLNKKNYIWVGLFTVFIFLMDSRDALFFSYPLLVVLTAFKVTVDQDKLDYSVINQPPLVNYAIAIALIGALPIIKGSLLPLTIAASLTGFILYWLRGKRGFAILFISLPLLVMVVLWHMAGQPISALLEYFRSMLPIISGFAEAMSTFPKEKSLIEKLITYGMIPAYVAVASLILLSIIRMRCNSFVRVFVIMSYVGLFLFIAFKAGFVRHDIHALTAGSALVFAALAVNVFTSARISWLTIVLAITTWASIHWIYVGASLQRSQIPILVGLIEGNRMGGRLHTAFNNRLHRIRSENPIPKLEGTTDIYPYDQAALIASGNSWITRPIPQSYSVYTPSLVKINEAFLRDDQAPDNVVFRVGTIDDRFPSLDDGLSWPTLITNYSILKMDDKYIYLRKQEASSETKKINVAQGSYILGNQVRMPTSEAILFAEIDVDPTFIGRIAKIFFKTTPLFITVELSDGQTEVYRFIPSMARTGFIISPLIRSTTDFAQLASGQLPLIEQNKVTSIRVAPSGSESMFWKRAYSLKISTFETSRSPSPLQRIPNSTLENMPE